MSHCIALFSGGLDSCLSIITLLRQGIKVTALYFDTSFGCGLANKQEYLNRISGDFGFDLKVIDVSKDFLEIVKKPSYGYGRNMNPCVDCKIMMLDKTGNYMKELGADFIATGEIVGQRPMSQQRHIFNLIEKRTGLKDYILRPLSALVLPPTYPEKTGMVDRSKLHGISGRKRTQQFALAQEYGLREFPTPSGGCLLTDPNYSLRLRELLSYKNDPDMRDLRLLKTGRHFRLSDGIKVIVGRNSADNEYIMALSNEYDIVLYPLDVRGPTVIIPEGVVHKTDINAGANLCAYYSDKKDADIIKIIVKRQNTEIVIDAKSSDAVDLSKHMIKR